MNVLCLFQVFDPDSSTIYLDLVNALRDRGHRVFIAACTSDRMRDGRIEDLNGIESGFVYVPDQFKAGKIRKGLIQLMVGRRLLSGVKRFFWNEKVDLIIYPTPPVTLSGIIKPIKKHFGAVSYLMLKDIFPQNAVDLGMMREGSLLHRLFKGMEKELYRESDIIGCMSPGNIKYLQEHEMGLEGKTELFPNTVKILEDPENYVNQNPDKNNENYVNHNQPSQNNDTIRLIFGGNLGRPQGVDFLLEMIGELKDEKRLFFTFIGKGTEEGRIRDYIRDKGLNNVELLSELPRREYEKLLNDADIGIVSLSGSFTIPNYPSRILSYMQLAKPMLAVTDRVTDIRALIEEEAQCGFWCPSGDEEAFKETVVRIISERQRLSEYGRNGREYLKKNFDVERAVDILEKAAEMKK